MSLEYVSDGLYGLGLVVANVCKWCGWFGLTEDSNEVFCGFDGHVSGGLIWYYCFLWEEFDSVSRSFAFGFGCEHSVASIVFHCRSYVPGWSAMWIP